MPKKNWTDEERAAFGAKMKAAKADKTAKAAVKPSDENIKSELSYEDLQKQIEELKSMISRPQFNQGVQVAGGRVIGTEEKYLVDPDYYPDPRARLAKESRLARLAFDLNYDLTWNVMTTNYETKDGINTKEPRFQLELRHIIRDEDGEPTTGRYILRTASFHEDPQAAITVARDNGVNIDAMGQREFLDEMRYLRIRDWLLDAFYPPKTDAAPSTREEVFNNQLVKFVEISSEDAQAIKLTRD